VAAPARVAYTASLVQKRIKGALYSVVRVIDWYVLRCYAHAYVVCALSFFGLYVGAEVFSRLKKFLAPHGIPLYLVFLRYYAVMIPVVYTYYLGPVLTLAAAMFCLTALNKNNEITPLKAAGVSLYRIVTPIFAAGFFFAVLTFCSQQFLIPSMRDAIREVYGYSHRTTSLRSLVLFDSAGTEFSVGRYWPAHKRAEDVIVTFRSYEENKSAPVPVKRYVADYMHWESAGDSDGGRWVLKRGSKDAVREYLYDEKGELIVPEGSQVPYRQYVRLVVPTDLVPEDFEAAGQKMQYLSLADLKRQWKRSRGSNNFVLVRMHQHFTFPLTHVILLLIGLPFVLNSQNRSVFLGVIVSVAIAVAFYVVNAMCTELGAKGVLEPVVAAWLPILIFTGVGVVLFDNLQT